MPLRRLLLPLIAAFALAACASGGGGRPPAPPSASIQKLKLADDGSLALEFRVQNYGKKAVRFETLDADLVLDGTNAGAIHATIGFDIPPRNSEVVPAKLTPSAALKEKLAAGRELRYAIKGHIVTVKPDARYAFDYSSALSPVPGVPNEFR